MSGRTIIPYDITLQLINGNRGPIDHEYALWGNELLIVLGGTADFYRDDLLIPLRKGDIFVLNGNYTKKFSNASSLHICNIFYWDLALQKMQGYFRSMEGYQSLFMQNPRILAYGEGRRLHADNQLLDELQPLIRLMEMEQYLKRSGHEQVLNSLFFALITLISRAFTDSEHFQEKSLSGINQAVAYLEVHFYESIKLADLAQIACMSERQFTRRFKEVFLQSPMQYLTHYRIAHACLLLEDSDLSISDIATESGFSDINYFSRCFKRLHQITPSDYRMMRREQITQSDWRIAWQKKHGIKTKSL